MVVYPDIHALSFLNTRASRAPDEPLGSGSCGGLPPLCARRRPIVLANVSGAHINEPKLARPAAQAQAVHRLTALYRPPCRTAARGRANALHHQLTFYRYVKIAHSARPGLKQSDSPGIHKEWSNEFP